MNTRRFAVLVFLGCPRRGWRRVVGPGLLPLIAAASPRRGWRRVVGPGLLPLIAAASPRRGWRRVVGPGLLPLIAAACGPTTVGGKGAATVVATHIEAPVGATLTEACTPTGPEICFNAADDNCNGVIDEGCGIATGPLQFTVAWGDSPADVDLRVTDPSGDFVDDEHPTNGAERLRLDRDCPKDACYGQNIENVLWGGLDPPRGSYAVDVFVEELHGASLPIPIRFGARVGSRSYGTDITLDGKDDKKHFVFTL